MKKRIFTLFITLVFMLMNLPSVYAAKSVSDLKKELSENQKKVEETKKEIKEKQAERNDIKDKKLALDIEISGLQDDIDQIQSVINDKNTEIEAKNSEIDSLNETIKETDKQLKKRMKIMYENSTTSYLELIMSAKGLSDLFTRISIIETILKHDKALINEYQTKKEEVAAAKQVIENEKQEQVEAQKILVSKQDTIESKQAQQQNLINELNADIEELKRQEAEMEQAEKQIQNQINAALKSSSQQSVQYKGNGKFLFPMASYTRVSSPYGYRIHPITGTKKLHAGIDYAAPYGTAIYAAEDGVVLTSGWINGYGYTVTINHGGGYVTLYAHCSKLLVGAGQAVKRGETIAKVGSTGNSTGNHLHFEVKVNGKAVNPTEYL